MRRAGADLWLGLRLALSGGPEARWRAALTATGVAFGVTLLLFAAAVPHIVHEHYERLDARAPVALAPGVKAQPSSRLLLIDGDTTFHGTTIAVRTVEPIGPRPPLPPGLTHFPAPGRMLVSPAVERLLAAPGGGELERRLAARVAGRIGDAGLTGPRDLFVYRGARNLRVQPNAETVTSFGVRGGDLLQGPLVTLLVIVMVVALLLPMGVFVATASRFGSEQRNARLAAMRLLGADRAGTARIAAGEALLGALAGVVSGIALFLALRPWTGHVEIVGVSVFPSDVSPSLELALLAVLLVPAASVAFALISLRDVAIEPLGVSRHATPARRRLLWRLVVPLVGFALLLPLISSGDRLGTTGGEFEAAAGVVLVLIGVTALLPWCVETAIARAGDRGPLPWLLAVRRLRLDHGTSARVVGAIGLTVAGAIALQTLFGAGQVQESSHYKTNPVRNVVEISSVVTGRGDPIAFVQQRLRAVRGVRSTTVVAVVAPNSTRSVTVAPCATLATLLAETDCGRNSTFLPDEYGSPPARGGHRLWVPGHPITLPADAESVTLNQGLFSGPSIASVPIGVVLMTPEEASRLGLRPDVVDAVVTVDPAVAGIADRLRDAVARLDPYASVDDVIGSPSNPVLDSLRHALVVGATLVLLVIGGSLLVAAAEQLRERRRVLAVLAAFGTRRGTLAASVLWQTALPVGLGLVLAMALGIALAAVLTKVAAVPVSFDWNAILLLAGTGLAVVAAVTALTLPLLWRQTRAEALRAE